MEQAVLGEAVLKKSRLQCLSTILPSVDALRSTKGACQLFPSTRAAIGSFSSVKPHLKLSEVNSSLSNEVENW